MKMLSFHKKMPVQAICFREKIFDEMITILNLDDAKSILILCLDYLKCDFDDLCDILDRSFGIKHEFSYEIAESLVKVINSCIYKKEKEFIEGAQEDFFFELLGLCYCKKFLSFTEFEHSDEFFIMHFAGCCFYYDNNVNNDEAYDFMLNFMSPREIAIAIWKL